MKIAVITGASSGIGAEFANHVIKERDGLDEIWVIARREDRLNALKEKLGEKIRPIKADITNPDDIEKYVKLLQEENAEVMLLINNAGYGKLGDFDTLSVADNGGMIRLNCEALTVMTGETLPFMPNGSEIINVCSIASFAPNIRMAVYCSTKAYVMSFSRALREELKKHKINVLAACPGPMETEFLKKADITPGASKAFDTLPRVNAAQMAGGALKASAKGRAVYTNKLFYKFYRLLAKLLPHSLVMKMAAT